jgi:hypothetical protein
MPSLLEERVWAVLLLVLDVQESASLCVVGLHVDDAW